MHLGFMNCYDGRITLRVFLVLLFVLLEGTALSTYPARACIYFAHVEKRSVALVGKGMGLGEMEMHCTTGKTSFAPQSSSLLWLDCHPSYHGAIPDEKRRDALLSPC